MTIQITTLAAVRVAINTRFLIKDKLEGLGVYTHEISRRLVALLPQHEWIFLFDRPPHPDFIPDQRVQTATVFPPARHPFLWYAWFELAIPRKLRQLEADLFFSPDGYASLRSNIPQLLTIHDVAFEHYPEAIPPLVNRYYRYFTPKFCHKAEHIICVSEKTRDDLTEFYGVPEEKISVVHNGWSPLFHPCNSEEKISTRDKFNLPLPYFMYLGAVHPRKNVLGILKAFERLKTEFPRLPHQMLLVGRKAWHTDEVENYCRKMSFGRDVRWMDHIRREEIPAVLGAAEALVYPSFFEGFGLPVLEAMACGVPSITSRDSPMSTFAQDACLTVDPHDIDELKSAMYRMATDESLRSALSEKCLQLSSGMTWDVAAEKIAVIVERLLYQGKKT